MTLREFQRVRFEEGFVYELIDGVLMVSPRPRPVHEYWVVMICRMVDRYAERRPQMGLFVSTGAEVDIVDRRGPTRPQPDIAVYEGFPDPPPPDWGDACPIIVVEVVSPRRQEKDVTRNRHLYWEVDRIKEYWIVDPSRDEQKPDLLALLRKPDKETWEEHDVPHGASWKSRALPGLTVNLKRRK